MRQWKPVKGDLFVSLWSDVLEPECLSNLCIVIQISQTQYSQAKNQRKKCLQKSVVTMLSHLASLGPNV